MMFVDIADTTVPTLILNCVIFPAKIQISKPIDMPYIHDYAWFKDDRHVIWMWIWLILKNIYKSCGLSGVSWCLYTEISV
jgi:hypothetical protein